MQRTAHSYQPVQTESMARLLGEFNVTASRVILLGASNLTLSFPMLFESLRNSLSPPIQIIAAHGHGRSYGMWSRVCGRGLPGIAGCRLWHDLPGLTPASGQTLALLTDVGNDLMYGADVTQICDWVGECLGRLQNLQAKIVMTRLPLCTVANLPTWKYRLTRQCLFPTNYVSYADLLARAGELDNAVSEVGARCGATLVEPRPHWYGLDPIHVRRSHRAQAWRHILSAWIAEDLPFKLQQPPLRRAVRLWTLRPAERRLWGRQQFSAQPALHDGEVCQLWLY